MKIADVIEPWALCFLKPPTARSSEAGQSILINFGSPVKAKVKIPDQSIPLQQTDLAAQLRKFELTREHAGMPATYFNLISPPRVSSSPSCKLAVPASTKTKLEVTRV
ncbi:hypothetical protein DFH28DRAFT_932180 [Melampsora americana]|nr:hypothetical protein DFH28DRAFT_932180 [Melampsora americana]